MEELDSIEAIVKRALVLEREEVVVLGFIPVGISTNWSAIRGRRIVLTGERRRHIVDGHPEMNQLTSVLVRTVQDPDEIHRNKRDAFIAIFWRRLEEHESYLRVAVLLSTDGVLEHSVMSAWRVRRKDFEREGRQGRLVWRKGEGT